MSTRGVYVGLLRGVNVGGRHLLPMKSLTDIVAGAGARNVRTYIQSGNVIFETGTALAARLPGLVSDAILAEHGFAAPVIVRSASELARIVRANPYVPAENERELYVAFLADSPAADRIASLDPHRSPPDEFVVRGREIYLRYRRGAGNSRLTTAYFDSRLATTSTARNWNTTRKLLELAGG